MVIKITILTYLCALCLSHLHGPIKDTLSDYESLTNMNKNIFPLVSSLVKDHFFRHFKVDLYKDCPFWNDNGLCFQRDCAVEVLEQNEELDHMWGEENLGDITKSNKLPSLINDDQCFAPADFCLVDGLDGGEYVDLTENPERFTGYSGESARLVWQAIYEQNCFNFVYGENHKSLRYLVPIDDVCIERRMYFKAVSGLHTSISIHLCYEWLDKSTGIWGPNLDCYDTRVGNHSDRIQNLYFLYSMMLQSIQKLEPYLNSYVYCNGAKNEHTKKLVEDLLKKLKAYPSVFDENVLTHGNIQLLTEFKERFRNVSKIMNCVGCQKCRLWGKIQVSGIGTALKTLFSYYPNENFILHRSEIVSLFNAFFRFSESIEAIKEFELIRAVHNQRETQSWLYRGYAFKLIKRLFSFSELLTGIISFSIAHAARSCSPTIEIEIAEEFISIWILLIITGVFYRCARSCHHRFSKETSV